MTLKRLQIIEILLANACETANTVALELRLQIRITALVDIHTIIIPLSDSDIKVANTNVEVRL